MNSIKGKQVVYIRGTNHIDELKKYGDRLIDEYINAYANPIPLGALKMLDLDRVDIFIVSAELLQTAVVKFGKTYHQELYTTKYLSRVRFYPLFQNNEKGKRLARIFDDSMQILFNNGELQKIYNGSQ